MSTTEHTSRRAVLAGMASVPALTLPAIAASADVDPVFAAIEAHRQAYEIFDSNLNECRSIEQRLWKHADDCVAAEVQAREDFMRANPHQMFADTLAQYREKARERHLRAAESTPEGKRREALEYAGRDAETDAAFEVVTTVPTSREGALALSKFLREQDAKGNELTTLATDEGYTWELALASLETYLRGTLA